MNSPPYSLPPELLERIRSMSAFAKPIQQLIGYWTQGGTYVIASAGYATDSGYPRDLVAILPGDLGQGRVVPLYVGVNPALVGYLEIELARGTGERLQLSRLPNREKTHAVHAENPARSLCDLAMDRAVPAGVGRPSCSRCLHYALAGEGLMAAAERVPTPVALDDKQTCSNCQDDVYTLSTRGWCDGCEEAAASRSDTS